MADTQTGQLGESATLPVVVDSRIAPAAAQTRLQTTEDTTVAGGDHPIRDKPATSRNAVR